MSTQPIEIPSDLPWDWASVIDIGLSPAKSRPATPVDRFYVAHAANAYPRHLARVERLEAALRRARAVMNCETSAYTSCDFNNVGFDDCSLRKEVEAIDAALAESEVADG